MPPKKGSQIANKGSEKIPKKKTGPKKGGKKAPSPPVEPPQQYRPRKKSKKNAESSQTSDLGPLEGEDYGLGEPSTYVRTPEESSELTKVLEYKAPIPSLLLPPIFNLGKVIPRSNLLRGPHRLQLLRPNGPCELNWKFLPLILTPARRRKRRFQSRAMTATKFTPLSPNQTIPRVGHRAPEDPSSPTIVPMPLLMINWPTSSP